MSITLTNPILWLENEGAVFNEINEDDANSICTDVISRAGSLRL